MAAGAFPLDGSRWIYCGLSLYGDYRGYDGWRLVVPDSFLVPFSGISSGASFVQAPGAGRLDLDGEHPAPATTWRLEVPFHNFPLQQFLPSLVVTSPHHDDLTNNLYPSPTPTANNLFLAVSARPATPSTTSRHTYKVPPISLQIDHHLLVRHLPSQNTETSSRFYPTVISV